MRNIGHIVDDDDTVDVLCASQRPLSKPLTVEDGITTETLQLPEILPFLREVAYATSCQRIVEANTLKASSGAAAGCPHTCRPFASCLPAAVLAKRKGKRLFPNCLRRQASRPRFPLADLKLAEDVRRRLTPRHPSESTGLEGIRRRGSSMTYILEDEGSYWEQAGQFRHLCLNLVGSDLRGRFRRTYLGGS
jgi:hypothetical protein